MIGQVFTTDSRFELKDATINYYTDIDIEDSWATFYMDQYSCWFQIPHGELVALVHNDYQWREHLSGRIQGLDMIMCFPIRL